MFPAFITQLFSIGLYGETPPARHDSRGTGLYYGVRNGVSRRLLLLYRLEHRPTYCSAVSG